MAVAKFLESSPFVEKVIYPGLPSHPQHELAKRQAKGFSGMVTFFIKGGKEKVFKFFDAIKVLYQCDTKGSGIADPLPYFKEKIWTYNFSLLISTSFKLQTD